MNDREIRLELLEAQTSLWVKAGCGDRIWTMALSEQMRVHPKKIARYLAQRYPRIWSRAVGRLRP